MSRRIGPVALALALAALAAPAPAAAQDLEWGPCPDAEELDPRQECAALTVPLDYSDPGGESIEIAVSRIQTATAADRRGVLVYNPGGPGESGINGPTGLAQSLPPDVLARYDLIGFDPRGINFSAPVSCSLAPEDQDVLRFIPYPAPDGDIAGNVAYSQRAAAGCAATSGDLLPHITTANTARDMNRIRAALGEDRISYLGYSYGTYLGAVYTTLFPQRTDRFVLDSVVHPNRIWRSTFSAWGPAAEVAFPPFARFAAERDATYGLGDTPREVRAKYFELIPELDAEPFVISGLVIDGNQFRELLRTALRNDDSFPELAFIWQLIDDRGETAPAGAAAAIRRLVEAAQPAAPTASPAAAAAADFPVPPADNPFSSPWAVVCGDADWPESVATYERDVRIQRRVVPLLGGAPANIWPCAFWPFEPRDPVVEIGALRGGRALLVESFRDPATPYDGAVAMRVRLGQRSRLLSVGTGAHSIAFTGKNVCADDATAAFLVTGAAADDVCPAEPEPVAERDSDLRAPIGSPTGLP
jgi:pimeloyl-ACP methyl ester carboxylesterase